MCSLTFSLRSIKERQVAAMKLFPTRRECNKTLQAVNVRPRMYYTCLQSRYAVKEIFLFSKFINTLKKLHVLLLKFDILMRYSSRLYSKNDATWKGKYRSTGDIKNRKRKGKLLPKNEKISG